MGPNSSQAQMRMSGLTGWMQIDIFNISSLACPLSPPSPLVDILDGNSSRALIPKKMGAPVKEVQVRGEREREAGRDWRYLVEFLA